MKPNERADYFNGYLYFATLAFIMICLSDLFLKLDGEMTADKVTRLTDGLIKAFAAGTAFVLFLVAYIDRALNKNSHWPLSEVLSSIVIAASTLAPVYVTVFATSVILVLLKLLSKQTANSRDDDERGAELYDDEYYAEYGVIDHGVDTVGKPILPVAIPVESEDEHFSRDIASKSPLKRSPYGPS